MAWVTPPVFVSGNVLTAAQLNTLSGDLNETAPNKATGAGQIFVSTAANTIVARTPGFAAVLTAETTASAAFTDLATTGPAVTATTGAAALVIVSCDLGSNTALSYSQAGYAISGATTLAPSLDRALAYRSPATNTNIAASLVVYQTGLSTGSNTFTMKYETSSGGGTSSFQNRRLSVIPL